jgi:signal transduction histidine kinase
MAVKYISIILGTIFEIYCINKFINIFSPRKEINKYKYLLTYIIISLFHILIPLFFKGVPIAIGLFITVLLFNQLYKSKQYVKMIISISMSVMYISSELLFGGIFMLISNDKSTVVNTSPEAYAIGTFLSKFFVFAIILIFASKRKSIAISSLTPKYLILLSILPITTIILSVLMYQVILVIESSGIKLTFVLANILLILSNAITFEIIHNQNKLATAEYELKLLKNNISEQTRHYEELRSSQDEIRQIRHNMKSIYIATIAELKVGKIENALEQLQSNIDIIEKSSKVIDTGHPSIDSIIENKLNKCDELNINANLSYQYKEPITINEIEIAVIIGNILDNAIEACYKVSDINKEIWGSIAVDNQNIIINIKNTAVSSNNLKTSKTDRKSHGYGLKSISHIAKKYNGYAKFSFSDNIFTSYVILEN